MSEAGLAPRRSAPWSDRVFAAVPLRPVWVGLLLAAALLGLLGAVTWASGELAQLRAQPGRWWQIRDARIAVVVALVAASALTARGYARLGAERNLEDLRGSAPWAPGQLERAARELRDFDAVRARRVGLGGLLLIPLIALTVDRDPGLYLRADYWRPVALWTWAVGGIASWNGTVLGYTIYEHARCFSRLGRQIPAIDLLDLDRLAPFARQGLRASLPGLIGLSFFSVNLVDRGFLWATAVMGSLSVAFAAAAVLLTAHGAHLRIRAEKRAELARVNAALRGDRAALLDSAIAARAEGASLADLLAYRGFVAALREWPFDAPARTRLLLYVAIPLGSWIGGAMVERLLEGVLG